MKIRISAAMAAVLFAMVMPAAAQQPPQARGRQPGPFGPDSMRPRIFNVELAMRQKQDLKLTDAQVSQLDAIRKEIVAERQERMRQMIDLQSRIAAGLVKREDVREQMQGKRDDVRKTLQQRSDRIAKILTKEQQDQLMRSERRMIMQRVGRRGGRGFGGQFGPRGGQFGPGFRGRFGPGPGRGFREWLPYPPPPPRGPGFDDQN